MSDRNVELYRRLYAVFNRHDLDEFLACFDPQIEFHSIFAAVGGVTVYRGRAAEMESRAPRVVGRRG